jgi:hypothetical protein
MVRAPGYGCGDSPATSPRCARSSCSVSSSPACRSRPSRACSPERCWGTCSSSTGSGTRSGSVPCCSAPSGRSCSSPDWLRDPGFAARAPPPGSPQLLPSGRSDEARVRSRVRRRHAAVRRRGVVRPVRSIRPERTVVRQARVPACDRSASATARASASPSTRASRVPASPVRRRRDAQRTSGRMRKSRIEAPNVSTTNAAYQSVSTRRDDRMRSSFVTNGTFR